MTFAKRTDWDQTSNAISLKIEELKSKGITIVDLTESNPTSCGFNYPASIVEALANPANLKYDPDARGMLQARQAVGKFCQCDAKDIILTASTSESYSFLFRLLLEPGDKVLIPSPSYPLFQFLLEINDTAFDHYPLKYKNGVWGIDFEALKNLIDAKTKAIILVNPNNPTGSYIKEEELRKLNAICKKHDLVIISDEVFFDFKFVPGDFKSLKDNGEALTFMLGGLSKSLGLPQMKLGWILSSGPTTLVQTALERLTLIADTFLSVNTPVQNALSSWFALANNIQGQIMDRVKGNLALLKQAHVDVLAVEGGWNAVVRLGKIDEEEFVLDLLDRHHILVYPGFFFDIEPEGHLVVSLLPEPSHFVKMIEVLGVKK